MMRESEGVHACVCVCVCVCMYVYIYIASSCDCEGVYAMMCFDKDGVLWSAVIATSASVSNLRLHTLVASGLRH